MTATPMTRRPNFSSDSLLPHGRAYILYYGDVQESRGHVMDTELKSKNGENNSYKTYYIKNMDISVDLTFQLASNVDYEAVEVAWQPDISCNKEQEDSICNEFISAAKTLVPAKDSDIISSSRSQDGEERVSAPLSFYRHSGGPRALPHA